MAAAILSAARCPVPGVGIRTCARRRTGMASPRKSSRRARQGDRPRPVLSVKRTGSSLRQRCADTPVWLSCGVSRRGRPVAIWGAYCDVVPDVERCQRRWPVPQPRAGNLRGAGKPAPCCRSVREACGRFRSKVAAGSPGRPRAPSCARTRMRASYPWSNRSRGEPDCCGDPPSGPVIAAWICVPLSGATARRA